MDNNTEIELEEYKKKLKEVFSLLHAHKIVTSSSDKSRAFIMYKIILSVEEYEQIESLVRNSNEYEEKHEN